MFHIATFSFWPFAREIRIHVFRLAASKTAPSLTVACVPPEGFPRCKDSLPVRTVLLALGARPTLPSAQTARLVRMQTKLEQLLV